MLAQPDCGDAVAACEPERRLGVNAEEFRGFDGGEERFPHSLDLSVVRTACCLHGLLS
jgi:hypothetical protein